MFKMKVEEAEKEKEFKANVIEEEEEKETPRLDSKGKLLEKAGLGLQTRLGSFQSKQEQQNSHPETSSDLNLASLKPSLIVSSPETAQGLSLQQLMRRYLIKKSSGSGLWERRLKEYVEELMGIEGERSMERLVRRWLEKTVKEEHPELLNILKRREGQEERKGRRRGKRERAMKRMMMERRGRRRRRVIP